MRTPLQLTGSIRTKSRLSQWALFGVLFGLGGLLYFEAQLLLATTGEGALSSGNPAIALEARLKAVSSGITSYLENHDASSLERIKGEGKEASRILDEFKERFNQLGENDTSARIVEAHNELREATVRILATDQDAVKARQALDENHEALASVLAQMQSSIKSNQLNASRRARALRVASAEARKASSDKTRFIKAVSSYENLSRTRWAERWTDQARTYFEEGLQCAANLEQAEQKTKAALDQFTEKRKALEKILEDTPQGVAGRKKGFVYVVLNSLLLLAAVVLLLGASLRSDRGVSRSLQNILLCAEAAAAGDTSRLPDERSQDEVGQLSQATGRLINVLARSENLVYHLAALVESSGDAIISQSLDGRILSWNKGAQRIYGYSAEEVKGQPIAILSPADQGAEMMAILRRIQNGERLQPFETIHQARSGRAVRAFVRVAAIYDSTRMMIGASFVAQDLSDIRLLQSKTSEPNQTV